LVYHGIPLPRLRFLHPIWIDRVDGEREGII
jgi:hypothetical protein